MNKINNFGHDKINQRKIKAPLVVLAVAIFFLICIAASGINSSDDRHKTRGNVSTTETAKNVKPDGSSAIDAANKFVELFNRNSQTPIVDVQKYDIHDKSSPYYRARFRLDAYKESNALLGKSGDVTVCIVQFGRSKPLNEKSDFLVYAFGKDNNDSSWSAVRDFMVDAAKVAWTDNKDGAAYVADKFNEAHSGSYVEQDYNVSATVSTIDDYANFENKQGVWQGELRNINSEFVQ